MPAPISASAASAASASASATAAAEQGRIREPLLTQIAGFVDLFVWLLVLKSFFLPLFQIPTGSMAETLCGAHAPHTCPNCAWEYNAGFHDPKGPRLVQCPNCRWREQVAVGAQPGVHLSEKPGDRIVVHGWPYDFGGALAPKRWDVVVFKVPTDGETNYIKRLVGLPGETIEIVDGDVFVNGRVARKSASAQKSLWLPYYHHDYPPEKAGWLSTGGDYLPRWVALGEQSGWSALESRVPHFELAAGQRGEIQFVTGPPGTSAPGVVSDVYGYNGANMAPGDPAPIPPSNVRDVRISTFVTIESGTGYVELQVSKDYGRFFARLYADGAVTLEHEDHDGTQRREWARAQYARRGGPVAFALGHADYSVTVWVDGRPLLSSRPDQYDADVETAKRRARLMQNGAPRIRIAAEGVKGRLAHLAIERDIFYTDAGVVNAGPGRPLTLSPREYFVMGDNSPRSFDARLWTEATLGPHLREKFNGHAYQAGTVPADQMIGRAFLVYWPGFTALGGSGPNILPDFGRIRWIH